MFSTQVPRIVHCYSTGSLLRELNSQSWSKSLDPEAMKTLCVVSNCLSKKPDKERNTALEAVRIPKECSQPSSTSDRGFGGTGAQVKNKLSNQTVGDA